VTLSKSVATIHHLNCGMLVVPSYLTVVCHCLLLQENEQLALIDMASQFVLKQVEASGPWLRLDDSWAMLLPVDAGQVALIQRQIPCTQATRLRCELRLQLLEQLHAGCEARHTVVGVVSA
jgi:hypothetical protein